MLTSHSRLTVTPESHFFAELPQIKKRFGENLKDVDIGDFTSRSLGHHGRFEGFDVDPDEVVANF